MKNKWLYFIIVILLIGAFIFLNRGMINQRNTQIENTKNNKLQVTASFYPLYFFAQEIGKEKANVKNLTPAGVEPHDFEPTVQDIAGIENSDLLIVNDAGLEPWYKKIKDDVKQKNVLIIEATGGLDLLEGDPHVWLDPQLAKQQVTKIAEGYIAVDPQNAAYYKDNEKSIIGKLDQLDEKFKQDLQNCDSRDIITTHVAFAYLAKRYGLNQVAISGLSPDEEPSAKQLAQVVQFAKKNNIKYIFFETLVSLKLAETIASEIGAKTLVLDPLEGLSDDDISRGKNYFTVMEDNLKNLQIALSCNK